MSAHIFSSQPYLISFFNKDHVKSLYGNIHGFVVIIFINGDVRVT
jgi:hypothetical protein